MTPHAFRSSAPCPTRPEGSIPAQVGVDRFITVSAVVSGQFPGLAVCFDGFRTPVGSLVADDVQAASALLACRELSGRVLVVSASQQIGPRHGSAASVDSWMIGTTDDARRATSDCTA